MAGAPKNMPDMASHSASASRHNLMIVSNRLPVQVSRDVKTGEWVLPMSPGGLVSALLSVSQVGTPSPSIQHCTRVLL